MERIQRRETHMNKKEYYNDEQAEGGSTRSDEAASDGVIRTS